MKKILLFMALAITSFSGFSQGDTCATAQSISCGSGELDYVSYTTTGLTNTAGNSSADGFFTFTPGAVQTVTIKTCLTPSTIDLKLTVYSDCSLSTVVAQNDNAFASCGPVQSELTFITDASSTYIIMVEGGDNVQTGVADQGDFEMVVYCQAGALPQAPQGIVCNPSTSGPSLIFTDSFEDQDAGQAGVQLEYNWTGDIAFSQVNGNSNSGLWEILPFGSSSSPNTGPNASQNGSIYMNFEATGTAITDKASAVSPVIDLTGSIVEDAELTFYMHAFGSQMGTLDIGVGNSPTGPFTTEYTWEGQYQSNSGDNWFQVGVDLSPYLGQMVYIEFAQTATGAGFRGDMSIDMVEVNACDTVLDVDNSEEIIEGITLYPNPAKDFLNIRSLEEIESVQLFNLLGQEVRNKNPNSLQTSLNLDDLETGIYLVKVKVGSAIGTYKIIKE